MTNAQIYRKMSLRIKYTFANDRNTFELQMSLTGSLKRKWFSVFFKEGDVMNEGDADTCYPY